MKLQSNITGEIKDWSFSEWLHYIIHSEGKAGEACDVKEFIERVEKFRDEWEENPKEAWFINPQGGVENWPDTEWADDWTREKEIGNYFETKEEAEKAVEKLKAWKRLKNHNLRVERGQRLFVNADNKLTSQNPLFVVDTYEEVEDDLDILLGGEE